MSKPQPSRVTAQRPHTGRGVPADRPDGVYEPPELVQLTATGLEVTVIGEGRRRRTFAFKTFPLPGWHQPLAEAFARCTGAGGTLRTPESAAAVFWGCRRFLVELEAMADSPATPAELTVDHLERYWRRRRVQVRERGLLGEIRSVGSVFGQMPPGVIAEAVDAWLHRRRSAGEYPTVPGYSDRRDPIAAKARPTPTHALCAAA